MMTRLLAQLDAHKEDVLQELAECDLMLKNNPSDGALKNRKLALTKLVFENEQSMIDIYQKYQSFVFASTISEAEIVEVRNDLSEINKHKDALNEDAILEKIDTLTNLIEAVRINLPAEFVKAWDENLKLQKKSSVTGKFKLIIPIIPKVFVYEKEMPYSLVEEFKQMRKDFRDGNYFLYPKK